MPRTVELVLGVVAAAAICAAAVIGVGLAGSPALPLHGRTTEDDRAEPGLQRYSMVTGREDSLGPSGGGWPWREPGGQVGRAGNRRIHL